MDREELKRLAERIKERLSYCPISGHFINLRTGLVFGTVNPRGYIELTMFGRTYRAHRLAFLFMNGEFPAKGMDVDHINGDRTDNRFENLRIASRSQNMANLRICPRSKSGYKGVSLDTHHNLWQAQISVNGKNIKVGYFKDPHSAAHAYNKAAIKYMGEFAVLNVPGSPAVLSQMKEPK